MLKKFRFRLIPLIATIIVVAIGLALAQWQSNKADTKEALAIRIAKNNQLAPLRFDSSSDLRLSSLKEFSLRKVKLRGEFVSDWPLYLDNRPLNGQAGFYLVMPFKIAGSQKIIMIARGWLPRNAHDRLHLPDPITPRTEIEIEGLLKENVGHVMQLGQATAARPKSILQNLDLAELARQNHWDMPEMLIEQTSVLDDQLLRDWPPISLGVEKHRAYAFQWYGLSLMAVIFLL